jgi:nicotinate-nucleotide adenylyltransferase
MAPAPRIAFFGGSFDPPHLGHLAVARAARTALALDTVFFAPVGAQPLKPKGSTASFDHRVAMTCLAIADEPAFQLSLIDAPAVRPNYTVDTLHALRATLTANSELFCLIGADSFLGLAHWHHGAEIPFVASLVVAARPGQPLSDLTPFLPAGITLAEPPTPVHASHGVDLRRALLRNPAGATAPLYLLPGLHVDISASDLRRDLRDPDRHHALPAPVRDYITTHNLYASSAGQLVRPPAMHKKQ